MKKIKLISAAVVLLLGLFILGEFNFINVFDALENAYPHISFNMGNDWQSAVSDIKKEADRANIIVFTYNNEYTSLLEHDIEVYSSSVLPASVISNFGSNNQLKVSEPRLTDN
jgi:hypothetical protein